MCLIKVIIQCFLHFSIHLWKYELGKCIYCKTLQEVSQKNKLPLIRQMYIIAISCYYNVLKNYFLVSNRNARRKQTFTIQEITECLQETEHCNKRKLKTIPIIQIYIYF